MIEPELESWVFSDSPHVAVELGWTERIKIRAALEQEGLWDREQAKPEDPKAAVEWILRRTGGRRSSSIYRELAGKVGLEHCRDRAFLRLSASLRDWYGVGTER